jgi:hypothetical protein
MRRNLMLTFSTEMYRVALDFASKEQTRYYLQGVYVQRHPKEGVLLVSTDGHRMICIHDQNGFVDEPGAIPSVWTNGKSKRIRAALRRTPATAASMARAPIGEE